MAAGRKLYPRATVKKIVKAHSKCNVSKNVDVLVSSHDASSAVISDELCRYSLTMQSSCRRMPPIQPELHVERTLRADSLGKLGLTMRIRLMKEATINAKQAGERGISAKSVKKVTEVSPNESSCLLLLT
jgi:hypothetical protein